jgi:hypothetical protein
MLIERATRQNFTSISQRAVSSYLKAFVGLGAAPDDSAGQRDLHAFFETLYASLFDHPEDFGLPTTPTTRSPRTSPIPKIKSSWSSA